MANQFTLPDLVMTGKNALEASEAAIRKLGSNALIVTGKVVAKTGLLTPLTGCLQQWNIKYHIFTEIVGEPTDQMIALGVATYREKQCDFIIALGGGSPLDSAKAIAAMSVLPEEISDYLGKEIEGSFPPVVLIPTTAGTGSEATKFTVITNTATNVKMLLKGNDLLPELAILDPFFTLTAPPEITAATGMDALTHAVEAYTSRKATPMTDLYAVSAVKRIFQYLPTVYRDGSDWKAREEMQLAAFEAGVSINNASVTLVHGMSRPIGAVFHVPHGMSNAMLIKDCLEFALDGTYEKFAVLGRAIGAAEQDDNDEYAARAFLQELARLCRSIQIPTLAEYGIRKEQFDSVLDKLAQDAIASGSPANTIKEVTKEDVIRIYKKLW